jgi:ferritin-like metal-binding protein YciE
VEHYEIAAYTVASDLARALGLKSALKALSETLGEEEATDAKLSKASGPAISEAAASERK